MVFIKVWCEWDFNGEFGGNNNEDVFEVDVEWSDDDITSRVSDLLVKCTGESEDDLEGLFGWRFVSVRKLGE